MRREGDAKLGSSRALWNPKAILQEVALKNRASACEFVREGSTGRLNERNLIAMCFWVGALHPKEVTFKPLWQPPVRFWREQKMGRVMRPQVEVWLVSRLLCVLLVDHVVDDVEKHSTHEEHCL